MRIAASIICGCMYVFIAGMAGADPTAGSGVSVMTACDSSAELIDASARKRHGQIARRAATETLYRRGIGVRRAGAASRQLDVSVTRWRVTSAGGRSDVTAEIRVVLCDHTGKMLSIANGKATVSGQSTQIATLREHAIAEGVGHLVDELGPQLARASS